MGFARASATPEGALVAAVHVSYHPDYYADHLVRSRYEGRTWQRTDVGVECRNDQGATAHIGGPIRLGSALVALWSCAGGGDRGSRVLVSRDDGRTWEPRTDPALAEIELGEPVLLDDGRLVATERSEQALEVVVRVTVDG